jgi:hypothetical protein
MDVNPTSLAASGRRRGTVAALPRHISVNLCLVFAGAGIVRYAKRVRTPLRIRLGRTSGFARACRLVLLPGVASVGFGSSVPRRAASALILSDSRSKRRRSSGGNT